MQSKVLGFYEMKKIFKKKFFFNGHKNSFGVQKRVFEKIFQKLFKKFEKKIWSIFFKRIMCQHELYNEK